MKIVVDTNIVFVDDILLNDNDINDATELVYDVDPDDALFVALTNHLMANLWTGDKRLFFGLKKKGFSQILTTLLPRDCIAWFKESYCILT